MSRGDRGQLLIITAISLAVLLVLMALALNTAAYGVVHAGGADGDLREERNAVRYEDGVRRGVAGLIPTVDNSTGADPGRLEATLSRAVANWSRVAGRQEASDGVAANASLVAARFETDIVHDDDSRAFTNETGETNWTVTSEVTEMQRYEMRIDRANLVNTSECAAGDTCFELSVDGGWALNAYRTNQKIVIRVDDGDVTKCEATDASVTVNLTDGRFDHPNCTGETFTPIDEASDDAYAIRYANADNVDGTYELRSEGRIDGSDYRDADSGLSPRVAPRLAGADVLVTYRSPTLHYSTVIRVDRGETDA